MASCNDGLHRYIGPTIMPNLVTQMDKRAATFCKRSANPCACMGIDIVQAPRCVIPYADISGTFLITGGCGFIGSNTVIWLFDNCPNTRIVCLDNLSGTYSSLSNIPSNIQASSRFRFVNASIDDGDAVTSLFLSETVRFCICLAAWLPFETYSFPAFVQNNIATVVAFMEICQPFCVLSTPGVIGSQPAPNGARTIEHIVFQGTLMSRFMSYRHATSLNTLHPRYAELTSYTSTKMGAIGVALHYAIVNQMPITLCHPGYVYGGVNPPPIEFLTEFKSRLDANEPIHSDLADKYNKLDVIAMSDLMDAYAILFLEGFLRKVVAPRHNGEIYTMREIALKMVSAVKGANTITNGATEWIDDADELGFIPNFAEWSQTIPMNMGACFDPVETIDDIIKKMIA